MLTQAIASHCARACDKLRQQQLLAQALYVFVQTNRFRADLAQYHYSLLVNLVNPTDDLRVITRYAKRCLQKIYKPGFQYKKVGVCLEDLIAKDYRQMDLFHQPSTEMQEKSEQWMSVLDAINQKYGRETIKLAAEGVFKPWAMRADFKSPAYTTRWAELPIAKNLT